MSAWPKYSQISSLTTPNGTMPPYTVLVANIQHPGLVGNTAAPSHVQWCKAQCCPEPRSCGSNPRDTYSLGEAIAEHLSSLVQQMATATLLLCSMLRCFQSLRLLLCLAEFSPWMFAFERDFFRRGKIWHRQLWSREERSLKAGPHFYQQ